MPRDSQTDRCKHCNKPIVYRAMYQKWFHSRNAMTYCTGFATSPTKAEPKRDFDAERARKKKKT